ncbi:MAG: DnaJ domain-containing protein [Desulfosalsimonadaceae bacterium]
MNRRNYYRILEVQPDADFDTIRQNYRVLLHRLRMHPDHGGSNKDAALVNEAYQTLSDPRKREVYDRRLLQQYDIETLSRGPLRRMGLMAGRIGRAASRCTRDPQGNRRNYYRVLGVQPDAHATVIRQRYLALLEKHKGAGELLHAAYLVLNNARKRALYDRLLQQYGHGEAARKMQEQAGAEKERSLRETALFFPDYSHSTRNLRNYTQYPAVTGAGAPDNTEEAEFEPAITRYCEFCKTPHNFDSGCGKDRLCPVCASPLFSSVADMSGRSARALMRCAKSDGIVFYVYWPGRGMAGRLLDLSPSGLRFSTEYGLDVGKTIKIDAEKFKAVGEVVHSRFLNGLSDSGVHFRTVAFSSPTGNFFEQVV